MRRDQAEEDLLDVVSPLKGISMVRKVRRTSVALLPCTNY